MTDTHFPPDFAVTQASGQGGLVWINPGYDSDGKYVYGIGDNDADVSAFSSTTDVVAGLYHHLGRIYMATTDRAAPSVPSPVEDAVLWKFTGRLFYEDSASVSYNRGDVVLVRPFSYQDALLPPGGVLDALLPVDAPFPSGVSSIDEIDPSRPFIGGRLPSVARPTSFQIMPHSPTLCLPMWRL